MCALDALRNEVPYDGTHETSGGEDKIERDAAPEHNRVCTTIVTWPHPPFAKKKKGGSAIVDVIKAETDECKTE